MDRQVHTVVIGAGQAGLATSYYLSQRSIPHVVLERSEIGEAWRSDRWDSFRLLTPNWTIRLPGLASAGDDPDGFLAREEVVRCLEEYAAQIGAPVQRGVEVTRVSRGDEGGFRIATSAGDLQASQVVVAAGSYQKPRIPALGEKIAPQIVQMHSGAYRNPAALPPGAVLVVGSGQSGCQIAEELLDAGRTVYLSTGRGVWMPRRFRGKDAFWWAEKIGMMDQPPSSLPSSGARFDANPQLSGKDGGRTINLHVLAREGAILVGRLTGADGMTVHFANDLLENVAGADKACAQFMMGASKFAAATGLALPEEEVPMPRDAYEATPINEINLDEAGIGAIIWATGYRVDFGWIDFPIFDDFGYPIQQRGVTAQPGLFFVGLHFMSKRKSTLLAGVGEDAAFVVEQIAAP